MRIRLLTFRLLGAAAIASSAASIAPAVAQPSFGDCAKSVERSGYIIYDMDFKKSAYEIDARKGGREWDIKTDRNCKFLDARPD